MDFADPNIAKLFPVPANERLTVNVTEGLIGGYIRIWDNVGRIRKEGLLKDFDTEFDISDLPSGIYFLWVYADSQSKIIPFNVVKD
jgi:hypothetical protein